MQERKAHGIHLPWYHLARRQSEECLFAGHIGSCLIVIHTPVMKQAGRALVEDLRVSAEYTYS